VLVADGMGLRFNLVMLDRPPSAPHYCADGKEGDTSFKPKRTRPQHGAWPSIVIEAGASESALLEFDAHWWLRESAGQVTIVVLIKIIRSPRSIRI
jgi:hypothetical protein